MASNLVALPIMEDEVFEIYKTFIEGRASKKTAEEYDRRVREFANFLFGKKVEHLKTKDVESLRLKHVETFVNHLRAKGNSESTILTKIRSVKSFFVKLKKNGLNIQMEIFDIDAKQVEKKHHNALYTIEEVNALFEFIKNSQSTNREELLMCVKTMFVTGNRVSSVLGMKWTDITQEKDMKTGELVWVTHVLDKGSQKVEKPITNEFYEELSSVKIEGEEKIFPNIAKHNIKYIIKKFGKSIGRELTVHSIKGSALTVAYKRTKDLNKVKQLGSHASVSTTEIYVKEEKSYTDQLSYSLFKPIDVEAVKSLSKERLLEIILESEDLLYAVAEKM